jgi:hypothetical protein
VYEKCQCEEVNWMVKSTDEHISASSTTTGVLTPASLLCKTFEARARYLAATFSKLKVELN